MISRLSSTALAKIFNHHLIPMSTSSSKSLFLSTLHPRFVSTVVFTVPFRPTFLTSRGATSVLCKRYSTSQPTEKQNPQPQQQPQPQPQPQSQQQQQQPGQQQQQEQQEQQQQQQKQQQPPPLPPPGKGGLVAFATVVGVGIAGIAGYLYLTRDSRLTGRWKTMDDFFFARLREFINNFADNYKGFFGESLHTLLPPPLPQGYGRAYTLIVDMDALADYMNRNGGWVLYKRAGVDFFLMNLFKNYEIVLYSKEYQGSNQQAIFKLDPTGQIFSIHKWRESGMRNSENHFTSDFRALNRDPSKVIFLDAGPVNYEHPNVLWVGKSDPNRADTVLIDLVPLLQEIASKRTEDVRPIVKNFQGDDIARKLSALQNKQKPQRIAGAQPLADTTAEQPKGGGVWGKIFGGSK